mgnify:CR=1 FL=1
MRSRRIVLFSSTLLAAVGLLVLLNARLAGIPPLGPLLDPADGLYRTARLASPPETNHLQIDALEAPVTIVRDERSVPHIFADSDRDAIIALGYVTAQDRLFQLDFIPRVASGRLAEAFGESAVSSDQFLRQTGMEWGAQKNLRRIREDDGLELDLIEWYGAGVNAYLDGLAPEDVPFEFRLLDYMPDRYTPIQALRLLQYMTFDLTYRSDAAGYARLQRALSAEDYAALYPNEPAGLYVPIIPSDARPQSDVSAPPAQATTRPSPAESAVHDALAALHQRDHWLQSKQGTALEGFRAGKGSNNWAAHGSRSTTGAPLLAGDMHLSLSLPAIWYEAHLVTPTMNTYGLTVPGAPILVEAFNDHIGWTFTNTGADQIDHYALELDSTGTRYRYNGTWRNLTFVPDTIRVNHSAPVVDTLVYSHFGPVRLPDPDDDRDPLVPNGAVAEQWVAHQPSRTLKALWHMNHATSLADFEEGLRDWGTPMQNILYAGRDGHIAIRSTGLLPQRANGHGRGLLDGTTDAHAWTGFVPFGELPYARDPAHGFLTSSNQKPTDAAYPHYLGHDWRDGWRSLRLDSLLRGNPSHSPKDFKRFQADVDVQQRDAFVPLLADVEGLSPRADTLRRMLQRWDGNATTDRPEPLVFHVFLEAFEQRMWDESLFQNAPDPEDAVLLRLMRTDPEARWFDIQGTDPVETAPDVLRTALEATVETLARRHGWTPSTWRWGDHHRVVFRHLSQSDALQPLWRGPYEYPGFASTVSPARGDTATHSASQRVVIDFSTDPPTGWGVVPGGQSGNPLDPRFYDAHLDTYLNFDYHRLRRPAAPDALPDSLVTRRQRLTPEDSR